jgi:hypothetical protein
MWLQWYIVIFFWPKTARKAPAVQALLNQEGKKTTNEYICPAEGPEKKPLSNYLYKWRKLRNEDLLSSLILWAWRLASLRNPIFQLRKEGVPRLKMKSFLCFQINQAPMMNVSMKKLLLWCSFVYSIIGWKSRSNLHIIPRCLQYSRLKGHKKKRWKVVSSQDTVHKTQLLLFPAACAFSFLECS